MLDAQYSSSTIIQWKSVKRALIDFKFPSKLSKHEFRKLKLVHTRRRKWKRTNTPEGIGTTIRDILEEGLEYIKPLNPIGYQILVEQYTKRLPPGVVMERIRYGRSRYYEIQKRSRDELVWYLREQDEMVAGLTSSETLPIFYNVPRYPEIKIIGRDNILNYLKKRLMRVDSSTTMAIHGKPGVGKTTIAIALAYAGELHDQYYDGLLWVSLGKDLDIKDPEFKGRLNDWAVALGFSKEELEEADSISKLRRRILRRISDKRMLLFIDDVWEINSAKIFMLGGSHCSHIITTRDSRIAAKLDLIGGTDIEDLSKNDGVKLLNELAPYVTEVAPRQVPIIVDLMGGLPLGLTLVGLYLRAESSKFQKNRIIRAIDSLKSRKTRLYLPDERPFSDSHGDLGITQGSLDVEISFSMERISDFDKKLFPNLSIFNPKPNSFSHDTALYVSNMRDRSLDLLTDLNLVEIVGNKRYSIHQVINDYLKERLTDMSPYKRLVGYYQTRTDNFWNDYGEIRRDTDNIGLAIESALKYEQEREFVDIVNRYYGFQEATGRYLQAKINLDKALNITKNISYRRGEIQTLISYGKLSVVLNKHDDAIHFLNNALNLSHQWKLTPKAGIAYEILGSIHAKRGDYEQAEQFWNKGLPLIHDAKDFVSESGIYQNLGSLERIRGRNDVALNYYVKGLMIAQDTGNLLRASTISANIAGVYVEQGKWEDAEEYLSASMKSALDLGNDSNLILITSQMGGLFLSKDEHQIALDYLLTVEDLAYKVDNPSANCILFRNIGEATGKLGDQERSDLYFEKALSTAQEIGYEYMVYTILCEWGEINLFRNEFDAAYSKFNKVINNITEDTQKELYGTAHFGLARTNKYEGRFSEAKRHGEISLRIFQELEDRRLDEVEKFINQLPKAF